LKESGKQNIIPVEPGQTYVMDAFCPADAPGIVNLFLSVYGEGYPIRHFYDAAALTEANEKCTCYSLVARTPAGEVVGAEHVFRSAPYERLYEAGSGLVLKEYRNQGITSKLLGFIVNDWGPRQENIEEVFGEPVCNHTHMQKLVSKNQMIETALEIALMPAEAYDREGSAAGRVSALLSFRSYRPKPHIVYLPPVYEAPLRRIYEWVDDTRDLLQACGELPKSVSSRADMTVFDFARVARIAMHEAGTDLATYLTDLESQAVKSKVMVFQVWLKLGDPWVGAAVEVLRDKDYFFGGVLPRWFDQDGLLMQKVLCDPGFEGIHLLSDEAREIGAVVLEDWKRTQQDQSLRHFA
jgi:GNAT superfamily N-acetyltransferase